MPVDSFKWVPRSIAGYYQAMQVPEPEDTPWTPLRKPIEECRFSLVTTAGLYVKGEQEPFDLERERREPTWGDPTYRAIPADVRQEQIGVAHLHINPEDIERDVNILLPVHRFQELAQAGEVGALAPHSYSFMGFQQDNSEWRDRYGPEVAQRMVEEEVDAALIAPA
jgi:D-proline reductase (dithiol) PrdB